MIYDKEKVNFNGNCFCINEQIDLGCFIEPVSPEIIYDLIENER